MSVKLKNQSKINLNTVLNRVLPVHRVDKKIRIKLSSDKVHYVNQNILRFSVGLTFNFANLYFDNYQGRTGEPYPQRRCKDWISKMHLLHRVSINFLGNSERYREGYPRLKKVAEKKGNHYIVKKMHRGLPLNIKMERNK